MEVSPPFLGGKNWNPMAYSQDTGLFYVPANHWKEEYWTEEVNYKKGSAYLGMGFRIKRMYEDHVGSLRAMDPTTGKVVWEHNERLPLWAGVLATKGNLVFTGTGDGYFKAFNAKDRRRAVEIPDRQRHRFATDHLGTGWRAVHRRDRRLRRCSTAVGWRHGRADQAGGTGWIVLGVQDPGLGYQDRQALI